MRFLKKTESSKTENSKLLLNPTTVCKISQFYHDYKTTPLSLPLMRHIYHTLSCQFIWYPS